MKAYKLGLAISLTLLFWEGNSSNRQSVDVRDETHQSGSNHYVFSTIPRALTISSPITSSPQISYLCNQSKLTVPPRRPHRQKSERKTPYLRSKQITPNSHNPQPTTPTSPRKESYPPTRSLPGGRINCHQCSLNRRLIRLYSCNRLSRRKKPCVVK